MPGNGTGGAAYGDLLVTSLVVLGGVCVAAFVVVRLAGRLFAAGRARGAHLLAVVARLPLEPRRSLYLVEVAGKTLLVGTSEMGLSLLSELDGAEVRERGEARPSFGELVRAAWLARRSGRSQAHRDGERSVGDAAPSAVAALDERGPARMGSSEARVSGAAALAAGMAREAPPRPGRAPRGGELARSEPGRDRGAELARSEPGRDRGAELARAEPGGDGAGELGRGEPGGDGAGELGRGEPGSDSAGEEIA